MLRLKLRLSLRLTLNLPLQLPPAAPPSGADRHREAANTLPVHLTAEQIAALAGAEKGLVLAIARKMGLVHGHYTPEQARDLLAALDPMPAGVA